MKKIGLILANPLTNYGAHLQAFATQYVIDRFGVQTFIIDMSHLKCLKYYFDFGFIWYAIKTIYSKVFCKHIEDSYDETFISNVSNRAQLAKKFRARMLHDEIEYSNYNALVADAKKFDVVIIGSDQMWLPGSSFSYVNSLRFVPNGVIRASYATSLGVSKYPRYCWHSAKKMWNKMNYVSVREKQGADIVKKVTKGNVKPEAVVDPTYLLSKAEWEEVVPTQKMCDTKYVLCYFLGNDEESKLCAKKYAECKKIHLVSILSCESFSKIDRTFADQIVGAASPEEFINWIRGAECVFTDSFHGLAFSVINHVQFYVFYRVRKDSSLSRNSRIDSILNMWNLSDRVIVNKDIDWHSFVEEEIDYALVEQQVILQRTKSLKFLNNIIRDENK